MKRSDKPGARDLPKTVFVTERYTRGMAQQRYLHVDADAHELAEFIGDDMRAGVYQLVGYVDVQNRTIASEVQPIKPKGAQRK